MEYSNEIEEGIINIPKSMNISRSFSLNQNNNSQNPKTKHMRRNSLILYKMKLPSNLDRNKNNNKDIFLNKTARTEKSKFYKKNDDFNSSTTKTSINDKIKKVTFSTVEIIRVCNYKKYNKLNSTKKVENDKNEENDNNCFIF